MTASTSSGDRLIVETGLDARIAAMVEPVLESLDLRLVRVRTSGANGLTLQIMAERHDGTMSVEDCQSLSRALSPVLEAEDPIDGAYHLEVSSPGIDRPLVRVADFQRWNGHLVKAETSVPVNGRKRFKGLIGNVDEHSFTIEPEADQADEKDGQQEKTRVAFSDLAEARLVLTDSLIRESLKADKQGEAISERRAANENRPDHQDKDQS